MGSMIPGRNSFLAVSSAGVEIVIPPPLPAAEELDSIVGEFKVGYALREAALFRIWRLWVSEDYREIMSDDPSLQEQYPLFHTFAALVEFVAGEIGVSRSKVYSRMKLYSVMDWLGFSNPQSVVMLADKPSVVEKIINLLYVWDNTIKEVIGVKSTIFGEDFDSEEHKGRVREFIIGACEMPNANDAIAYVSDEMGTGSSIKIQYSPASANELTLWCFPARDNDATVAPFTITFELASQDALPEWVVEELVKKHGSR